MSLDNQNKRLKIGFSHNYIKLHDQKSAVLVDARIVRRDEIKESGYKYDSSYFNDKTNQIEYFPLEEQEYIRLILFGCDGIPFTTYRAVKTSTIEKYIDNIGQIFDIYIKQD